MSETGEQQLRRLIERLEVRDRQQAAVIERLVNRVDQVTRVAELAATAAGKTAPPSWLTPRQAAERYGFSSAAAFRKWAQHVATPRIPFQRKGKRSLICRPADIERALPDAGPPGQTLADATRRPRRRRLTAA